MALTTWSAGAPGVWSAGGNWSAGVPGALDDAVFDNTSVQNCDVDVNPSINSLTVAVTYTGFLDFTGQTFTCAANCTLDGDNVNTNINFGNGFTMNGGAATLHIGSTVKTATATSCALTMNGAVGMTLDDDKGVTFLSLTLGANAVVTSSGGTASNFRGNATMLTLGAGSTLTINQVMSLDATANLTFMSLGAGYTINGNSRISCRIYMAGVTGTIPALTLGGTVGLYSESGTNNMTITMSGAVVVGGNIRLRNIAAGDFTINTGGNAITCATMQLGTSVAGGTFVLNAGASVFDVASFETTTYNTAATTLNLNTSTWTVSGNIAFGTNTTVVAGTSAITVDNTSTITSAGESFYDLTFAPGAVNTVTLADALTCTGDWTITNGALATGNFAITVTLNMTFNGAGVLNFGTSTVTSTGNAVITFNAGPTYTTNNSIWIVQGNTAINLNANVTVSRLQTNTAGQTITWLTAAGVALTIGLYVAGDIGNAAGNVIYVSAVPGTQYDINWPAAGIVVTGMSPTDNDASGGGQVDATDGTSVDGGNNLNWLWPVIPSGIPAGEPHVALHLSIGMY